MAMLEVMGKQVCQLIVVFTEFIVCILQADKLFAVGAGAVICRLYPLDFYDVDAGTAMCVQSVAVELKGINKVYHAKVVPVGYKVRKLEKQLFFAQIGEVTVGAGLLLW